MRKFNVDLFVINSDGVLEINKPEAREIPAFKEMLARDKGSPGDHDGRKKLVAFKEFMFIHLYYHPLSTLRDLEDKERFKTARGLSNLNSDWEIDSLIEDGGKELKKYLELTSLYYTYINISKSIYSLGTDVEFFNKRKETLRIKLQQKIKELDETIEEEDIERLEREVNYASDSLMKIADKITSINNSLPQAYETLEKLKDKIMKEESDDFNITGGGRLGNRES